MYLSDIANQVARHFSRPWQEVAATRDDERTRLLAAIVDPVVPAPAREALIAVAIQRLAVPGELDPLRSHHERVMALAGARRSAGLEDPAIRGLLEQATRIEAACDSYLAVASEWAEGCEMEMRMLERSLARVSLALAADGAAAATGVITAVLDYVTTREQVDAYARGTTAAVQAVTCSLAHHREVSQLALALLEVVTSGALSRPNTRP